MLTPMNVPIEPFFLSPSLCEIPIFYVSHKAESQGFFIGFSCTEEKSMSLSFDSDISLRVRCINKDDNKSFFIFDNRFINTLNLRFTLKEKEIITSYNLKVVIKLDDKLILKKYNEVKFATSLKIKNLDEKVLSFYKRYYSTRLKDIYETDICDNLPLGKGIFPFTVEVKGVA